MKSPNVGDFFAFLCNTEWHRMTKFWVESRLMLWNAVFLNVRGREQSSYRPVHLLLGLWSRSRFLFKLGVLSGSSTYSNDSGNHSVISMCDINLERRIKQWLSEIAHLDVLKQLEASKKPRLPWRFLRHLQWDSVSKRCPSCCRCPNHETHEDDRVIKIISFIIISYARS